MKIFKIRMLVRMLRLGFDAWRKWTTYATADGTYSLHLHVGTEAK